ncbi:MAG: hypothetical protein ACFFCM_20520, partial [Promethearchaeota archaeon]
MGSALYRIKIDTINQGVIKCKIYIIHPDVADIPATKTFAMSIILDCWRNMLEGYFFPNESFLPISEKEAKELAANTKYYAIFESLERLSMGYKEYIKKEEYKQIDEENCEYRGIKIAGYG